MHPTRQMAELRKRMCMVQLVTGNRGAMKFHIGPKQKCYNDKCNYSVTPLDHEEDHRECR